MAIGAAGVLVVGLAGGAWALREIPRTCHGAPMAIGVAVQPDIGPAVRKVAARFNVQTHEVRGRCVRVEVTERDPATVARTFAGQALGAQGVRPAVDGWLPESWIWIYLARSTPAGAAHVPFGGDSVAASPLVLAGSAGTAEELRRRKVAKSWNLLLKGRADTLGLSRRILDPAASAVGITTLLAAHTVDSAALPGFVGAMESRAALTAPAMFTDLTTLTRDQRSLMASTEQQVVAYNDTHRANPAVALVPEEGTFNLNYPFLVTATDPARKEAAEAFRATLLSRAAQDTFQGFGFRAPQGTLNADLARRFGLGAAAPRQLALADPAKVVVSTIRQWNRLAPRLRLLVLIDASGSMGRHDADGRTRLQLAAQALRTGLRLLPDGTRTGLWSVATAPPAGSGGPAPYRQLVPLSPVTGGGKGAATGSATADRIGSAASRIRPLASAGTGLYDAILAAYRTLGQGSTADRDAGSTDVVLVLTDGDDDTVRLRGLYDALRAQQNPRRPVQVVTVAFGPEGAGSDQLRRVGELTGGGLYSIGDPARLGVPFEQALAPHLCTPACTASSP
ncbi:substrate-binding domain-containing protein [Actinomadura scrupuli]|uniref:substrate-binding domain-containing protein n=1 Tax=Actinomadura scrupuli TaxID=559629 RepID=UPI003D959510